MSLSTNFTKKELTKTDTGIPNNPNETETSFLKILAVFLLQPIRDKWGKLTMLSGFRCVAVNAAVGGSPTGQHPLGQAGDFTPEEADFVDVYEWIVNKSGLHFGSCIIYPDRNFIHISLPRTNKGDNQALIHYEGEYLLYSESMLQSILKEVRG